MTETRNMSYEEAIAKVDELQKPESESTTEGVRSLHDWANEIRARKSRRS